MGTLYLVSTPLGNLEDFSPRAIRTLHEVALIAAEDTRVTRKLLSHFHIHTKLTSYFEHNKVTKLDFILANLNNDDVALVSDAGTPTINDPGFELVRAALAAGYSICPIPGPSAPLAALAASGLSTDSFLYLGYLPRKASERRELFGRIITLPYTLIFLESPHRLLDGLADLYAGLGDREISIGRELTKVHEQFWRGSLREAHSYFTENEPRGEFTLVISGNNNNADILWDGEMVDNSIKSGVMDGEQASTLAKRIASESGWDRNEIYRRINMLKKKI